MILKHESGNKTESEQSGHSYPSTATKAICAYVSLDVDQAVDQFWKFPV